MYGTMSGTDKCNNNKNPGIRGASMRIGILEQRRAQLKECLGRCLAEKHSGKRRKPGRPWHVSGGWTGGGEMERGRQAAWSWDGGQRAGGVSQAW